MVRILKINYERCTGCRLCEQACSVYHENVLNHEKSRIKIVKWEDRGIYVPLVCRHCEDAKCIKACPTKALYREPNINAVLIDEEKCMGCKMCITACPFGAISFNPDSKKIIKCDLCGGDPQCIQFCDLKAIDYVPAEMVSIDKKRDFASKIIEEGIF